MPTMEKHVCPSCGYETSSYKNPKPTVDIVIFSKGTVGLISRANEPFGWALPGGFIDYGETTEQAAMREAEEETCLIVSISKSDMVGVYSDPKRDPRAHNMSVAYAVEVEDVSMAKAADDAADIKFFDLNDLPEKICFDHRDIIADAKSKMFPK